MGVGGMIDIPLNQDMMELCSLGEQENLPVYCYFFGTATLFLAVKY